MPSHNTFLANEFAPKAWNAICDLLGGEDRIAEWNRTWNDGFIVNLGTPEGEGKDIRGHDLPGWHVDGDFFVHHLDSPEQGLLVIPLFTDIKPGGGGSFICPGAIPKMAKHLYDHPEGVSPHMIPRAENPSMNSEMSLDFFCDIARSMPEDAFVEATGKVNDVYLLHPLMLHSASNNKLRQLRVITNPPVSLKEPFVFDRKNSDQYSVVERKTLAALGKDGLKDWKITYGRDQIVPERVKRQQAMREQELKRLKGSEVNSLSVVGVDRSKTSSVEASKGILIRSEVLAIPYHTRIAMDHGTTATEVHRCPEDWTYGRNPASRPQPRPHASNHACAQNQNLSPQSKTQANRLLLARDPDARTLPSLGIARDFSDTSLRRQD